MAAEVKIPSRRAPRSQRSPRSQRLVEDLLAGITVGSLELCDTDGVVRQLGDPAHPLRARIDVHDRRFYSRLLHGGSVGLGESFVRGDWSSPDTVTLIRLLIANRAALRRISPAALANVVVDRMVHLARGNRPGRARRNIIAHYDLSNELYATFLDSSMTYSSARFAHAGQSLEDAQRAKLVTIAERARLGPDMELLEIGCG